MTFEKLNEYREFVEGLQFAKEMRQRIQAKGDMLGATPDHEGMSTVHDGSEAAFAAEIADCEAQAEMYRAGRKWSGLYKTSRICASVLCSG